MSHYFRLSLSVFILFCLTVFAVFTPAQSGTTSIRGTVTDNSGGVIANAKVTLSSTTLAVAREVMTTTTGAYDFLALQPGLYQIKVELDGFRTYERKNLQLLVNTPLTLDVTLEVGTTTQTIEITAQTQTLNTVDASIGNAFSETQVRQLPLEGRNVPDLLSLQAGVMYTGNRNDVNRDAGFGSDTRSGAVNGARSDQSNVTLDGIGVNDEGGHAFTSVLPVTLDSVQEFRVTTSNANADEGSAGGAQVALVTKSGTNDIHGSLYEYHRNTYTSANDYLLKATELQNGLPNNPPKLIRNIFGGSVGGPVKKDRLFFFMNYEGTRRAEEASAISPVPSAALRDGVIQYSCGNPASCPGGTVTGVSGTSYNVAPGTFALSPQQLTQIDPLHLGPNTAALAFLNTFPNSNSPNAGDGLNYQGINFAAPISETKNEYIAKLDYNLTRDAKHRLSVTGALRNDANPGAPFLPGQAPSLSLVNYNKGIIANYSGVLKSSLVNNFRYGFIRESVGKIGNNNDQWVFFRNLTDPVGAITYSSSFQRPTHIFNDDLSWIHGKHSFQFGTQVQFIRSPRESFNGTHSFASANPGWLDTTGFAGKSASPLNPPNSINPATGQPYPAVDGGFANAYDFPLTAMLGIVSEVDAVYNFQRDGSPAPDGAALKRNFAINSYEFYMQDTWKVKPTFTLTLGLRYNLFSPPWETNGLQVSPTFSLSNWFSNRVVEGANGIPSNQDQPVAFDWSGPANGKAGFYNWDYKNLAPRIAFAWAPEKSEGILGSLLGSHKTSIRGGFGIVYDRFGQGLVDDFDQFGSFGLSTSLPNQAESETVSTAPRLTDIHTLPTVDRNGNPVFLPAPPANFPVPFPPGNFSATTGLDSGMKTPYAYTIDLSVGRELPSGFSLEVSYVGRLSHRLLNQEDLAMPLNFKDKKSGLDYFTALTSLAKIYRTGETTQNFNASQVSPQVAQYWADVLQPLQSGGLYQISSCTGRDPSTNQPIVSGTSSPLVAAYDWFCGGSLNETTPLQFLDLTGIPDFNNDPNCDQPGKPACRSYFGIGGPFTFFTPQYSALYAFRTNSSASYHALQVSFRHRMSHGIQFDFNYTYSKSIDLASDAERVGTFGGTGASVINSWSPNQFRGVSDFDATHQFNANWIAELPFGRGRTFGHDTNKVVDAIIGGWQLSGLFRQTSGLPFSIGNGFNFPTNWDLTGNAVTTASNVQTGAFKNPADGTVNAFKVGAVNASSFFREPFPGEAGQRNNFRGDGFFGLDMGLAKRWHMPWKDSHSLQLRWEVFNVLNATRFDPLSVDGSIDTFGSSFGNYTRLLTNPRVMQFALRYEF
ncbi:MAG TPA: carboxypeptidase-like regulatory domain-containing protein [Candidatus Dormibacteraeota bacterium]|nr:carboxypeptidase-like regulatory domain-containing protein [Candidatus Dormibacteraeota bacterium]